MRFYRCGMLRSILCSLFFAPGVFWSDHSQAGEVRLAWKDTSNIEHGFKIDRLAGSDYVNIATVGPDIQSYTDFVVTSGTTYCYRVSAFNSAGISLSSNTACTMANAKNAVVASATSVHRSSTTAPEPTALSRLGSKWSDYRVSMNFRPANDSGLGVIFRYQDSDNYYRFLWNHKEQVHRLEKRVDGTFKVLAQDAAADTVSRTYGLEIIVQGPSIKVLIDGKTIFSLTDSSFSEGTIGLYSFHNTTGSFDDILVEEIATGKILLSDNFNDLDHRGWTIIDESGESGTSKWSATTGALVARSSQSNSLGTYALFTQGTWQDYRVTFKMRSADKVGAGVMFRFQDNNNHYRFSCEDSGRRLIKQEDGLAEVLAKDALPCIAGRTYLVEILAQGSSLQVKVDGGLAFSVNDQSFKLGTIALHSSMSQPTSYDDVIVEDLPTKALLLWDDFKSGKFVGWTIFDEHGATSAPSDWKVVNGELVQSNIGGSSASGNASTFALY